MPTEKYANDAQTTLSAAIASGDTSLTVAGAAAFPSSGNFRLLIDSEILLVTAVSGNTFTVGRAQEGTAAAAHANSAYATHVLTAASLANCPRSMTATGDLEYLDANGNVARLAAGANGQLLALAAGLPAWHTLTASDVTTALGDANVAFLDVAQAWTAKQTYGPGLITSPFGSGGGCEAFGSGAGRSGATGANNTILGVNSGRGLTSGQSNTLVGVNCGGSLTTGSNNIGLGVQALQQVTDGGGNVALGVNAGNALVHGNGNFCLGTSTLSTADVSDNVAIGQSALQTSKSDRNVGIGTQTTGYGGAGCTGADDIGIGYQALKNVTAGAGNVCVGFRAGQTVTSGPYNTLVGYGADVGGGNLGPCGGFGQAATPTATNEMAWSPYLTTHTFHGLSSTSTDRVVGKLVAGFSTSTDASRTGYLALSATDHGGDREGLRVDSSGSAALLGFYGVTPIARAVLATGAGHTVDDVIQALQNLGLVKQS